MVRRFLLLRCPGSGYGGGLALTAASLGAGVAERGRLLAGRRGNDYLAASAPRRTSRCDLTSMLDRDAERWLTEGTKGGAGSTETGCRDEKRGVARVSERWRRLASETRDGKPVGKWNREETGLRER